MNNENLIPINQRSESEQREMQRNGGIASGKARRENKAIAAALSLLLEKQTAEGQTLKEAIIAKCINNAIERGDLKDLKIIAELLGELKQTPDQSQPQPIIIHASEKSARLTEQILNED